MKNLKIFVSSFWPSNPIVNQINNAAIKHFLAELTDSIVG